MVGRRKPKAKKEVSVLNTVAVISASGKKLMPTSSYRARKLLKKHRAVIYKYRPIFTIQLIDREDGDTQPIEYKCDTGYQYIGISICSEKKELINEQRDLLNNETERHNDCRKYRHARRNRKTRYRKPRFNNRRGLMCKDGFAPSIRNKREIHINLFKQYYEVLPITNAVFEVGQFDTQVLKAVESGSPIPQGEDYQHGDQYGYATLREAVFGRDNYTCVCCGKSAIRDGKILRMHHLGYLNEDRSNRMSNLATVCADCHTSKNHKPGGKLYNLKPKLKTFKGATFMSTVRYDMLEKSKDTAPDVNIKTTYGAATKLARKDLSIKKTHSNDAYCMGVFHPKHRTDFKHYKKCRRNNRILSKFYDAKYIDIRDKSIKSGSQLSCGRTNRSVARNTDLNERIYRDHKKSKGKFVIRKNRSPIRPGDIVYVKSDKYTVSSSKNLGKQLVLRNGKLLTTLKVTKVIHCGAWEQII